MKSKSVKPMPAAVPEERGPNGYRVGYAENGDKVEWVPDKENPGEEYPEILVRNERDVSQAYQECWDKVWWYRNRARVDQRGGSATRLSQEERSGFDQAKKALKVIEDKYGKKSLPLTADAYGLLCGRLSALAWVKGEEWEDSLDT